MASFARKFGWVLIVTVLLLFLFPLSFGSFTQTHGPTSALRAVARAQAVFAMMASLISLAMSLIVLRWLAEIEAPATIPVSKSDSYQLRC